MSQFPQRAIDWAFLQCVGAAYCEHRKWLLAVARHKTGNYFDAEDALHNLFLSVLEEGRFPAGFESEPKRALYEPIRNKAIDIRRTRHLKRFTQGPIHKLLLIAPEPSAADPGRDRRLRRAMNALDRETATIVILRYWHGHTLSAIGEEKSLATSTVDSILQRALEILKKQILMQEKLLERGSLPS